MPHRQSPNSEQRNMKDKRNLRVVLDSVVFVSAFVTEDGLASKLLMELAEKANLYISEEILQEIRHVLLEKAHIRKRFSYSNTNVEKFIEVLRAKCKVIESLPDFRVIERDPKDDKILACAVYAQADYIVSRDLDLLDLGSYQEIQIVTPEDFIQYLRNYDLGLQG